MRAPISSTAGTVLTCSRKCNQTPLDRICSYPGRKFLSCMNFFCRNTARTKRKQSPCDRCRQRCRVREPTTRAISRYLLSPLVTAVVSAPLTLAAALAAPAAAAESASQRADEHVGEERAGDPQAEEDVAGQVDGGVEPVGARV